MKETSFDIVVVGAGHAGIEACMAATRLGLKTLLLTTNTKRIGYMSCNPSIGGLAKGHMVREMDALGGLMGLAADATCIQFKRLNAKKGPAVRGSRAQCDKDLYCDYMVAKVREQQNLVVVEGEAHELLVENGKHCVGVVTHDGVRISSRAVIMTTGTFMNGVMHIGLQRVSGGRVGDRATSGLSDQLRSLGFAVGRLKTGTPPRLFRDSIQWEKLTPQYGDQKYYPFSRRSEKNLKLPQIPCYLSYTNERTHEIIRNNLHQSPMFLGIIEGTGPRYCPSVEDKITRFADKDRHQTFLEPEGLNTDSVYLQGISTSLPEEVQYEFLKTIPGLEQVRMIRPGYAVEYDFLHPTGLSQSLESRGLENLFLAGQINGTSGYEEAAAQGLMAGLNAARKILDESPLILERHQAYIGVMIDDLVTKGTKEPYRMMTSRAEFRLVLREDNTYERLTEIGRQAGLVSDTEYEALSLELQRRRQLYDQLEQKQIVPNAKTQEILLNLGTPVLQKPIKLSELLRRAEITSSCLNLFGIEETDEGILEQVEVAVKYSGYIERQNEMIDQFRKLERLSIPADTCFAEIKGLSHEECEKLILMRPSSIGQAARISGVNPSAIQAMIVYFKGREKKLNAGAVANSKVVSRLEARAAKAAADLSH